MVLINKISSSNNLFGKKYLNSYKLRPEIGWRTWDKKGDKG